MELKLPQISNKQIAMKVRIEFLDQVLGTTSGNPGIYTEFIAAKNPDGVAQDELDALPTDEKIEKTTTIFPKDKDGNPFLWNYQIKGFFKSAAGAMNRINTTKDEGKLQAHKKIVDTLIFVFPRQIPLIMNGGKIGFCERPLRGQTAQGERIALARSECLEAGTQAEFTVLILDPKIEDNVHEWLDYGQLNGLLQWRNSGKGSFSWEEVK